MASVGPSTSWDGSDSFSSVIGFTGSRDSGPFELPRMGDMSYSGYVMRNCPL
uniref:Uncharacterized protein n=1 Tax=Babesia bovis TaxID=5865 RepID=S6BFD0_BABBO|nr:hypothetical protein [Babesia bovis]